MFNMFTTILDAVLKEASIAPYYAMYEGFVASLGQLFPFLLIALCFFVGMFGGRFSGIIRVVLLFSVGFIASVYWVAPFIGDFFPQIPALWVGLAAGVVAAVFSRLVYNLAYIGCISFDVYNICFGALFFVELTSYTQGNNQLSLMVAAGAVIIALFLRKYLEMLVTAAAGGIGVAFFVKPLFDYTVYFEGEPMVPVVIVGSIIAIFLFIYQYRSRVYYV
jgi:hypothetical protein